MFAWLTRESIVTGKRFAFKLIPNYSITTADAERNVWQVLVNIRGVAMGKGFCPLSLEFVSVCIVHKSNIKLGLREKITSVSEGGPVELTEAYRDWETDRKSTRLNSSHITRSRMPSSA